MTEETFGPYRLERLVSRSGTGEVWQATEPSHGLSVTLTRLPLDSAADPDLYVTFRSEAALAARLHEPHIIPIYDFGEIDGQPYIATRVVAGTDLGRLIAEHGPLTPARAVNITTQVAAALDAAHRDGLVHRDIRPGNLLVGACEDDNGKDVAGDEFVYVSGIGIAGSLDGGGASLPAAGPSIGALEYAAPEWLLHGHVDHRVDIYALGCLLYEAITARKPFLGDGHAALINAHLNTAPPRASQYEPGVPAALDQVIATAMAKEPDHRYRSAGDLASAARAALTATSGESATTRGATGSQGGAPEDAIDPPTVPRLRLQHPSPRSQAPPNRTTLPLRTALASAVALLLATGVGVLSLHPARTGPTGAGTPAETTNVSTLPTPAPTPAPAERSLLGHAGTVCAVATAQLNGRPVAISGSWDKTIRVWDLTTGAPIGNPLTGHTDLVLGVATTELNGRPVAVSSSKDETVRVWDLTTGAPIGSPFTGHTDTVFAVATAQLNGRPVAISGSADKTIRVWDLATGAPIGSPLTGHTSHVFALATAQLNGRPVVVSGSADKTIRVWDLATGAPIGRPFTGHTNDVSAVATAQLNGRPVVISGSADKTIRVWDLATGAPIGKPFTGHTDLVSSVATVQLNGRPVVISSSLDKTVRVWDLATGAQMGTPFAGHTDGVWAVTTTELDGQPVVISGSADKTARVWDLATQVQS